MAGAVRDLFSTTESFMTDKKVSRRTSDASDGALQLRRLVERLVGGSGTELDQEPALLRLERRPGREEQGQSTQGPKPPGQAAGVMPVGSHGSNRYAARWGLTRSLVTTLRPSWLHPPGPLRFAAAPPEREGSDMRISIQYCVRSIAPVSDCLSITRA